MVSLETELWPEHLQAPVTRRLQRGFPGNISTIMGPTHHDCYAPHDAHPSLAPLGPTWPCQLSTLGTQLWVLSEAIKTLNGFQQG